MVRAAFSLIAVVGVSVGAACSDDTIGTTDWTLDLSKPRVSQLTVGHGGHVAGTSGRDGVDLTLVSPMGELLWTVSCDGLCGALSVDADGRVFRWDGNSLIRHAVIDGAVDWELDLHDALSARMVAGSGDRLWLLANTSGPLDLGGGTLVPEGTATCWAQLDAAGEHLASGCFDDLLLLDSARVMPAEELSAIALTSGYLRRVLLVFEADGEERWRIETDRSLCDAYVGADGQVSLVTILSEDCTYPGRVALRLDAERRELWRRELDGARTSAVLSDGGILMAGQDGLSSSGDDVAYLEHLDPSGDGRHEVYESAEVAGGAVLDGFHFSADGVLVSRREP